MRMGKSFRNGKKKRIEQIAECLDNLRRPLNEQSRKNKKGVIPYWGANNIVDYIDEYIFDETIVLLAEDGGNFNEYQTRPIANLSKGKCWVNNHTHVLKGRDNILINEFLFFSLVNKDITGYISGGTRSKLTKGEMMKIKIIFPCLKEQSKISEFLSTFDKKVESTKKQIEAAKQWKKGLLQQMFV